MKRSLVICLTAWLVFSLPNISQGQDRGVLEKLGFSSIKGTITQVLHPTPKSPEEVNAEVAELRDRMMAGTTVEKMSPPELDLFKRQIEKGLAGFRKMKTEGQRGVVRFQVIFGSNGILGSFERVEDLEKSAGSVQSEKGFPKTWILQQPDKRVAFDELQDSVRVDPDPLSSSTSSELENLIHMTGGLGRIGALADISVGKKDILKKGGKVAIFETAELSAKFRDGSDLLNEATIVYRIGDKVEQREVFDYKKYERIGTGAVPLVVDYSIRNSGVSSDYLIEIDSWELGDSDKLGEVQLPKFGYVTVVDTRVSPFLQYPANGKVLSEKQLLEFVADPTLLKAYTEELENRRYGR